MDYESFKSEIVREISDRLGEEYRLRVFEVRKNNGVLLDNLSILKTGGSVSPCIYLPYYYAKVRGGTGIGQVAEEIIRYYRKSLPDAFHPECYFSRDNLRSHIVCRLINTERNRAFLEECPHVPFLDLSVVFYILFDDEKVGSGTIALKNEHLGNIRLGETELLSLAMGNMRKLMPADFVPVEELILELRQEEAVQEKARQKEAGQEKVEKETGGETLPQPDVTENERQYGGPQLYVLTNSRRNFGAVWMTDPDILRNISEKLNGDFYLLPSSVHECMVLPANCSQNADSMVRMVHEINVTQVAPDEILADSVYRYDRRLGRLLIAA